MTLKELIENKSTLDYQQICTSLIQTFSVDEKVNWESVLPAQQQQEYFGGESLRLIAEHPILSKQKDIRPIALKKGSISQMLFFYVCLNDSSLPKKQIQDVTKKFISGGDANRYIIWFFGNKEKTQLKVVLSAKEGKKVVLKTLPFGIHQPYYKTYNFILNEVNQKVNQLFVEPTDLWKALWNAFDISIINRNFYDEIKSAFTDLLKQLNKKGTPFTNEEDKAPFAIRLIGRIIFCWFLKRKEVLHDAAISSEAVKAHSQKNYYHDLLEPLFFDVLNTPDKERKGGLPKIIAHYPFLNGGLFEAQETDYKQHLLLNIDNDWFYNLFSKTLERYNFTVDENSSSNAEIAIDPEMLGRIFENLLAEQNPETGDSARKATGSFYTPREIVDYMVEQSVAEFLKNALVADEKTNLLIEDFVHTQMLPDALAKHEEKISNELSKIKVLDPACGSGAFPIGILQKIVALKQQLHPKAKNYKLKLDTIQNSIYGVDIQPMAVELSRLRCWLSLVVDEDPKDIKALPNLDFKFVCADSLVDVPLIEGYTTDALEKSLTALEENVEQYFSPDYKNKKSIKRNIETSLNGISKFYHNVIAQFITQIRREEKTASDTRLKQLKENLLKYSLMDAQWNSYENIFKNKKVEFFNPTFFFPSAKKGFDIVIGNPPYVNVENLNDVTKKYLFDNYKTCKGRTDIYIAFIETTMKLLKEKGSFSFIIPYPFTNQNYGALSRKMLIEEYFIQEIVDTSEYYVFESAVVKNIILRVVKTQTEKPTTIKIAKSQNDFFENSFKTTLINQNKFLELKDYRLETKDISIALELKSQVWKRAIRLDSICLIAYGARLNHKTKKIGKEAYIHSEFQKGYKPFTEGKNIERYKFEQYGWLDYQPDIHYNSMFPELFENDKIFFINVVKDKLRFAFDNQSFYNSHTVINCVKWDLLQNAEHTTVKRNITYEKIKTALDYDYSFLLGVLNSKLINWYFLNFLSESMHFYPDDAKELPIPKIINEKQQPVSALVNQILFIKQSEKQNSIHQSVSNNLIAKQLEEIIDGIVLELYFSEVMKTKKVNIIELVEKELEKAKSKDTVESIYNFYKSVSHPDSEIRNRILSFAIVSPDILKPILQG
jgi:adenine-specific DNA-methyltransferase